MSINIRAKGANGEREVADDLNLIINMQLTTAGLNRSAKPVIQRNQNQSAVGGSDLTNPFNLCMEIKRQEALSVNTWWKQCETAAKEFGGEPILIFKQNRKPWRVVMYAHLQFPGHDSSYSRVRVELSWDDFKAWFGNLVYLHINKGNTDWVIK